MSSFEAAGAMCREMINDHEREYHHGQMEVETVNECPEPQTSPPIYTSIQEQAVAFLDDARFHLDFRLLRAIQCIVEGGVSGDLEIIAEAIDQVRCYRDTRRTEHGWDRLRGMGISDTEHKAKQDVGDRTDHTDPFCSHCGAAL